MVVFGIKTFLNLKGMDDYMSANCWNLPETSGNNGELGFHASGGDYEKQLTRNLL